MQEFIQLPIELQSLITAAVIAVVGWAFVQLFKLWPGLEIFLGQYVDEVGVSLAAAVVGLVQQALNLIPPEWEVAGNAFLAFVVAVLIVLGVLTEFRKARNSYRAWRSRG